MLAGKFPAGTGAFKGNIREINTGLIGLAAAALALAPHSRFSHAFAYPFGWIG